MLPSKAQSLVANGSFEERNTCTESRVQCAPEAWFFLPEYFKSSPKANSNHIEILISGKGNRSTNYIYSKLLCGLEKGETYQFSLWIKADPKFEPLDVWMGGIEPTSDMQSVLVDKAKFTLVEANSDSTRENWKRYSYEFAATGDERYLMLGNLFSYEPPRKFNASSKTVNSFTLYYIDDIVLRNAKNPKKTCPEYAALLKQVYSQDYRHPARFIEDVSIDKSLIDPAKREVTWVIVDTPPAKKNILQDTLIIPDILFRFNSSEINKDLIKSLDSILKRVNNKSYKSIEVIGHTDDEGSAVYNQKLSLNRAIAIRNYIAAKNLFNLKDIKAGADGESRPRSSNKTTIGRQQNRRVEIILTK